MTASFLVFAMSNATAQRDTLSTPSYNRISIVAGFAGSTRLDAAVSPATFAGAGYSTSLTYEHIGALGTVVANATWNAQHFRPQGGLIAASERVAEGSARMSALHRVAGDAGWSASAGAAMGFSAIGTDHRYTDPSGTQASFFGAFATIGPAANLERRIIGGAARFELDAPLVGIVDRGYSAARTGYTPLALRRVGPGELQCVDAALSYSSSPSRRVGIISAYRIGVMNYRDPQPLRVAAQSLSIGLTRRFGGGR